MVIFNTGVTRAVLYKMRDSVGPIRPITKQLAGIGAGLDVTRIGMIRWEFRDKGETLFIVEVEGYYVPECRVKLLSPQQYLRAMNGGWLIVDIIISVIYSPNFRRWYGLPLMSKLE